MFYPYNIRSSGLKIFILILILSGGSVFLNWSNAIAGEPKIWLKAVEMYKNGQSAEADIMFTYAIAKNPNNTKMYYYRGKYRMTYLKNYPDAIQDFNVVINASPKGHGAYWYRGMCYDNMKQYPTAIRNYSMALKLRPRWGKLYLYRAKAYAKIGMTALSLKDLQMVVKYDPKYKKTVQDLAKKIAAGEKDF